MGFELRRTTPSRRACGAAERVREWVTACFDVRADGAWVMVSEVRCDEEGCPPVETVIAIMEPGSPPRRHAIHRPLAAVTEDEVRTLAARVSGG